MNEAVVLQTQTTKATQISSAGLLQRQCSCGGSAGLASECTECQSKRLLGKRLQTKLRVNEPGDEYEQEADRMAEQLMRMSDQNIGVEDAHLPWMPRVQRKVSDGTQAIEAPSILQDVLSSAGEPLDATTRAFFEPRFGHDFGNVRVHSGAAADQSARNVSAHAFAVGNDLVFAAERYAPRTPEGRHLLAHELTHVVQQGDGNRMAGALQRSPVFPDGSCDSEKVEAKITEYVAIALELVKRTVAALSNPDDVAGPLRRFFHFDVTIPGQMDAAPTVFPTLRKNLLKLQATLEAPVNSYCETGPEARGKRGSAEFDPAGFVIYESGITYNRNTLRLITLPRQIVNTIIHEYAHLADIGHHQPPGEPVSNEDSTKVRGLTLFEALNNAESYMRFVRAVSSEPRSTGAPKQPNAETATGQAKENGEDIMAAGSNCGSLDQLLPPLFPQAEGEERPTLEAHYPRLQGKCFRLLRGGDDSCFGYCLHRAAGGDPLAKGVNLPIPSTIEEFETAFAQYCEPIELDAVDAANPPGDAVLALFARGDTPTHTACRSDIQYEGAYLWESKVSPVFPLILHHLSDLEGGAAGDVVRLYKRRADRQP